LDSIGENIMAIDWNKEKWFKKEEPAAPPVAGFFESVIDSAEDAGLGGLKLAQEGASFVKSGGAFGAAALVPGAIRHTESAKTVLQPALQPEPAPPESKAKGSLLDLAVGPLAWGSRLVESVAEKAGASELSDTARAVRIGSYLAGGAVVVGAVGYLVNSVRR
jgi:hypothetical protein